MIYLVMKKDQVYGTTEGGKVLEFKTRGAAEKWLVSHVYHGKPFYNFPDYWVKEVSA